LNIGLQVKAELFWLTSTASSWFE